MNALLEVPRRPTVAVRSDALVYVVSEALRSAARPWLLEFTRDARHPHDPIGAILSRRSRLRLRGLSAAALGPVRALLPRVNARDLADQATAALVAALDDLLADPTQLKNRLNTLIDRDWPAYCRRTAERLVETHEMRTETHE